MLRLPDTPMNLAASEIAGVLRKHHIDCRMIGGAVRDLALGRTPDDIDLAAAAPPEKVLAVFPDAESVGAAFGVLLVKRGGFVFEVASTREERSYLDGRHPENVRYSQDFAVDAARRDFTINAMNYDFFTGKIGDFFGGLDDLKKGIIRTVGDAEVRFSEDYLRMLRCMRFAARYSFAVDAATFDAVRHLAGKCALLAPERVRAELENMLTSRNPASAMELLKSSGILSVTLPELDRLSGVTQHPVYHPEGDVWQHTMLMLRHMAFADADLAWSVLFHDLGKFTRRTEDEKGIHFYCHEEDSGRLARAIMTRLRFSTASLERIADAVRNHMRFAQVSQMKRAKLRRLIGHPDFPLQLELNRLDCIGCHALMDAFVRLLDEVAAMHGEVRLPEPFIMGRDLVEAHLKPSPQFKTLLETLYERQLAGDFSDKDAALRAMRDLIKCL